MRLKTYLSTLTYGVLTYLSMSTLQAEFAGEINLTNGYRCDKITADVHAFDPPGTLFLTDDLKVKNLSSYQIGLKGRALYCSWLARAEGDYAWTGHGKYHEDSAGFPGDFALATSTAHVHKGNMADFTVGGGYLFNLGQFTGMCGCDNSCGCDNYCNSDTYFGIGPVAGWSYSRQQIKLKDAVTNGLPDPVLDDLKYTNRWQGPWLGVDLSFKTCQFTINAGYEYHWADWHASWRLDGPDVLGVAFSDRRHSKHAQGQVGYIDGRWNVWCNWTIGIGLKYQNWRVNKGRVEPLAGSFPAVGLSPTEVDRVKATWQSFAATFDIGYSF